MNDLNGWAVAGITALLILASAFFVIIEFSLLAARRHRLEADAPTSRAARAALRGMNELTVMLASAQLGITVCTFALGAITKPAVDYALRPVFNAWGWPPVVSDVTAFMIALIFVTFLHLVVGEMAPKSWAIAHPETAAKAIGVASRAFTWPFRPFLLWINHIANRLVAASGIEPVERAAAGGQDINTIRELVDHSHEAGVLAGQFSTPIVHAIELGSLNISDVVEISGLPTSVSEAATAGDVQAAAARSGHLRILVGTGAESRVVHVRDTLAVDPHTPVAELARPAHVVTPGTSVYEALTGMRRAHVQLATVVEDGTLLGVVSLNDVLREVLPGPAEAEDIPARI